MGLAGKHASENKETFVRLVNVEVGPDQSVVKKRKFVIFGVLWGVCGYEGMDLFDLV